MALRQIAVEPFKSAGLSFDNAAAQFLTEAYFLLSEGFKARRLETTHRTSKPKIAAITCASVCSVNPLRVSNPDYDNPAIRYANPMFAMRCACAIIEHPYHLRAFDERRRTYDRLLTMSLNSLDGYIADRNNGILKDLSTYDIKLTAREVSEIEVLVQLFEVLKQMPIMKRP